MKFNRNTIRAIVFDVMGIVVILLGWYLYRRYINAFLSIEIVVDLVVIWILISGLIYKQNTIRFAWMGVGSLIMAALASAGFMSTATYLFSSLAFIFLTFGFLGQLVFERHQMVT